MKQREEIQREEKTYRHLESDKTYEEKMGGKQQIVLGTMDE